MSRPANMVGRKGQFTEEQVREWRAMYARRRQLLDQLRETPTARELAQQAGVQPNFMRQVLSGESYGWVR